MDAEEEDVENLFKEELPEVKVLSVRLIRDKIDSSKRGIAFVDVYTEEMAEKSLKLNSVILKGKALAVYRSKPPGEENEAQNRTMFLTNLPLTATEGTIREHLTTLVTNLGSSVEEIRLIRDSRSGRPKGFAYI